MSDRERLLAWYDAHRRPLPWREHRDPWPIWLSEVMLQQTRVETVEPYFHRFLERFPTVLALAAANREEVLAAWSGLGYYRRARQLHEAAQAVAAGGGEIPRRAAELERLPGIGPYTAAAIASIAFGEAVAVLDGNVARVLARYTAEAAPPATAAARRRLLAAATELLVAGRPGDSNQALMELGATLCLPERPRCVDCPLAAGCAALAAGRVADFPRRASAAPPKRVRQIAAVVEEAGRYLLFRRAESAAQLAGLWELPLVDGAGRAAAERALEARYGGAWRLGARLVELRHSITTTLYSIAARRASCTRPGDEVHEAANGVGTGEAGWFGAVEAEALALTGATRKILSRMSGGSPAPARLKRG